MENYDDPDCTDPETGLYCAFAGEMVLNCPDCGQANTLHVKTPTNRFECTCSACGLEFVAHCTLTPVPESN